MKRRLNFLRRFRILHALTLSTVGLVSHGATLPAGSVLELRLRQEVNSYSSEEGTLIQAYLCSPVMLEGKIYLPMETIVRGRIKEVKRVGLGLVRERAWLQLEFYQLVLPNGEQYNIRTRVTEVENARERVMANGRIRGIRSADMPGHRSSGVITSLAALDPIALAFASVASAALLRFSEPEIRFPVGTELLVRISESVELGNSFSDPMQKLHVTDDDRRALQAAIRKMPFRTKTLIGKRDSDLVNVLFVGSSSAMERAFVAAGWVEADRASAQANYQALRAFAENQGYRAAPMSTLLLDGRRPVSTLSKAMNTFHKRHHVRIFETAETWQGHELFSASSTQDVGVGFSKGEKKFTHRIDPQIDNERAKVLNDLLLTGCVDEAEALDRPWVPRDAKNAGGENLATDGAIAIVRLNDCLTPRRFDEAISPPPGPFRGNAISRASRQTILTVRNDFYRGTFVYQGITGAMAGVKRIQNRNQEKDPRQVRQTEVFSESFFPFSSSLTPLPSPIGPASPLPPPRETPYDIWEAPRVELSMDFGFLRFGNNSSGAEGVLINHRFPLANGSTEPFTVIAENLVRSGISMGGSVTLNSQRWMSHELGLHYQRGKFKLGLQSVTKTGSTDLPSVEEQNTGIVTRQFSYNTLLNLKPRESRWRPYLAAGPVLQMINLSDSPFKQARGLFRFGLNNVGMLSAAYNFGNAAPLEGGGIFQMGAIVGAGFKYRVHPRWTLRFDYRDTISKSPNFLKKSLTQPNITPIEDGDPQPAAAPPLVRGRLIQQRMTVGFSFTF